MASVVGEKRSTGYVYTVVLQLRESAGVAATITSVDLAFISTTLMVSSHHDQPVSSGTNVCPASGTVATRELVTVDADVSHPYATRVQATVTFTDATTWTGTASGTADLPPLSVAPPPQTYTLTGVITDADTHADIAGAKVEVLTGLNVGKTAIADGTGTYVLRELLADTFRLRASADNYIWGDQGVTVPDIPRADFFLHQACVVSVSPTSYSAISAPLYRGALTLTANSSTCVWNASTTDDWITLAPPTSGTGSSTIYFTFAAPVTASRTGSILISWPVGSTPVSVEQRPATCTPSGTTSVPAAGRAWYFNVGEGCVLNTTMTIDVPWLHAPSTHGGGLYLDVHVDPNPGAQRIGHITMDGHGNGLYAQYTFVQ